MTKNCLLVLCLLFFSCSNESPTNDALQRYFTPFMFEVEETLDIEFLKIWNVEFARMDTLKMDIFEPIDSDSARWLIIFASGGGGVGVDKTMAPNFRRLLAGMGFVVMSIEYRVNPQGNPFNCAIYSSADYSSCISWVRQRADSLRIDADKILAMGGSHGGAASFMTAWVDTSIMQGEVIIPGFDYKPNLVAAVSSTLNWTPLRPCNWSSQVTTNEQPPGFLIAGKTELRIPQIKQFFFYAKNQGVLKGTLINSGGHGIPQLGEERCAEIIRDWIWSKWGTVL